MQKVLLLLFSTLLACGQLQAQCTNRCLDFDPTAPSDYVQTTSSPVTGDANFTVEARFLCTSTGTNTRRLFAFGGGTNNRFEISESGGALRFTRQVVGGSITTSNITSPNVRDAAWHHLAATRTGTTVRVYLDGTQVYTTAGFAGALNTTTFRIGASVLSVGATFHWDGLIDEVRVWNVERTTAEINEFRLCWAPCNSTGLKAYYRFDQGIPDGNNPNETVLEDCNDQINGLVTDFALTGSNSNWVCSNDAAFTSGPCCAAAFTTSQQGCGSVDFNNTTTGDFTYSWAFGDGGTSTQTSPSYTYTTSGTYTVTLTATPVTGGAPCSVQQTITVTADNVPPTVACRNATINYTSGIVAIIPNVVHLSSSDVCCPNNIDLSLSGQTNFTCADVCMVRTVTLVATDCNGNTATCTALITVNDAQPPTALCKNVNVGIGPSGSFTIAAADVDNSSTDNCLPLNLAVTPSTFGCPMQGCEEVHVVVLRATDCAGSTSTCTAQVTVRDVIGPVFTNCPSGNSFLLLPPNECVIPNFFTATAIDNCDASLDRSFEMTGATNISGPGDGQGEPLFAGFTTISYFATDDCGNTTTCSFTVFVQDQQPPTVNCPPDMTVTGSTANGGAVVNLLPPMTGDNCLPVTVTSSHPSGSLFPCTTPPISPTVVFYTATDASGNTAVCSFRVTVECIGGTCQCGGFSNLSFGPKGGKTLLLDCGETYTVPCPVAGTSFEVKGDFACVGDCSPSNVTWEIKNSGGMSVASGTMAPSSFTIAVSGSAMSTPGTYTLTMGADCGPVGCTKCVVGLVVVDCGSDCTDFNDNSVHNWRHNVQSDGSLGSTVSVVQLGQNGTGDFCLQGADKSRESVVMNTTYPKDWATNIGKCFCFDMKFKTDGDNALTVPAYPNVTLCHNTNNPLNPSVNPQLSATFLANYFVTENSGWVRVCAPIDHCDANGNLPSNATGQWVLTSGSGCSDWETLLQDVTHVWLGVDYFGSPSEVVLWDNICIKPCEVPNSTNVNCDSLSVSAHPEVSKDGACCWAVDLNNQIGPANFSSVFFEIASPDFDVHFANPTTTGGFISGLFTNDRKINLTRLPKIPAGISSGALKFCLEGVSATTPDPIRIIVSWNERLPDGTEIRRCRDTLDLSCAEQPPCDALSASLTPVSTTPGQTKDCCYRINLSNAVPTTFASVNISVNGAHLNIDDVYPATGAGWGLESFVGNVSAELAHSSGYMPTGSFSCGTICLSDITASTQLITLQFLDAQGLSLCDTTFKVTCDFCATVTQDTIRCIDGGLQQLTFCIEAADNLGYSIQSVVLTPLQPGVTFTPKAFSISPPLAPGDPCRTITTTINLGASDLVDELCYTVTVHEADITKGIPPLRCCMIDHCTDLPDCLCDSTITYATFQRAVPLSDGLCCYNITLHQPAGEFVSVETAVISAGSTLSGVGSDPDWDGSFITPKDVLWMPDPSATLPAVTTLPTLCFGGEAPQVLEITWMTEDSMFCQDQLRFNCTDSDCAIFDSISMTCNTVGGSAVIFKFEVTNFSGLDANHIALVNISPTGVIIGPKVFPINLPDGFTSPTLMTMLNNSAGTEACFQVNLYFKNPDDSLDITDCCLTDTLCFVMPRCTLPNAIQPIMVFPNPTRDEVTVYFGEGAPANGLLRVRDLTGRLLHEERLQAGATAQQTSISAYPPGLYFIEIVEGERRIWSDKVVRQGWD